MRVSTSAQNSLLLAQIQATQGRMAENNIAISSGTTAQRYAGIPADAKRLVSIEATHVRLTQFVENNSLVDQRLQSMESAVGQMIEIAGGFRTQLIQSLNAGTADLTGLDTQAQNLLEQVGTILNVDFDGRYLFSGSKTDTAPVDLNDAGFLTPPGVYPGAADTNYYQGDNVTLGVRAATQTTVSYGVRADESAFEELIRSLKLVATATVAPVPDNARISEALRVAQLAVADLPVIQSRIGIARDSLDTANASHNDALLYAEKTIGELSNTDLTKAITVLTADRSTLEASFATLAQMGNISLLNFL